MKIAMVSEHASPLATLGDVDAGGQNVHVAALSCAFARRGHHVVVYTRRDDRASARRVPLRAGVDVVHLDAGPPEPIPKDHIYAHVPRLAAELAAEWSREPPDVVHAHFWMSGLAALEAGRVTGVPVALTYHALGVTKRQWQGENDTSPGARLDDEAMLARSCDRVIATAKHEIFDLLRMGANRRRLSLVPCGVDLGRFHPGAGSPSEPPRNRRFRLLCVSRLVERKGIGTVVEALPHLADVELVIVGGPADAQLENDPEARRLMELADVRGVADRTVFMGPRPQRALPSLYRSADVVVCTPWYEPFGMVALEAMACGVPTVVSAVGGLVDTVLDGVTGAHVPARDPRSLAAVLERLLPDVRLRAEMGRRGARRARDCYGWDAIAADTARAYQATLHVGERTSGRSVG
jgi:D-inositol-3-phosphate glycosyltransferase